MKFKRLLPLVAVLGFMSFNTANADVITFDGLAGTNLPGAFSVQSGAYTYFHLGQTEISGYTFTGYGDMAIVNPTIHAGGDAGQVAWNGTDVMPLWPVIVFGRADGGAFSFKSLDLANYADGNGPLGSVYLSGAQLDGTYVYQALVLENTLNATMQVGNDFRHFTLADFDNLISLSIGVSGAANVAIDNLEVVPVPEPATFTLMFAALGLLGHLSRGKKLMRN